jgi:hypothetical protein
MKIKLFITGILLSICGVLFAQDSQPIQFDKRVHDFGQLIKEDGRVKHTFEFTNVCKKPITIINVRSSCGCTVPTWTKEPIAPKKKGEITAVFNPTSTGRFGKSITVAYKVGGGSEIETIILNIKGEVISKSTSPAK